MKALILVVAALSFAETALASPCGEKIAALQKRYDAAPLASGSPPVAAAPDAAESTGAKLHHQPTPASPADANESPLSDASVRDAQFRDAMEQARAADDSGDAATCEQSVATAQRLLSH